MKPAQRNDIFESESEQVKLVSGAAEAEVILAYSINQPIIFINTIPLFPKPVLLGIFRSMCRRKESDKTGKRV